MAITKIVNIDSIRDIFLCHKLELSSDKVLELFETLYNIKSNEAPELFACEIIEAITPQLIIMGVSPLTYEIKVTNLKF